MEEWNNCMIYQLVSKKKNNLIFFSFFLITNFPDGGVSKNYWWSNFFFCFFFYLRVYWTKLVNNISNNLWKNILISKLIKLFFFSFFLLFNWGFLFLGATTTGLPLGVLYRVKVIYKYTKEDPDELEFDAGDIINVTEYDDPEDQVCVFFCYF